MYERDTKDLLKHILMKKMANMLKLQDSDSGVLRKMTLIKSLLSAIIDIVNGQEHNELVTYTKRHGYFSNGDIVSLSRKVKQMLQTKYVDLQSTYFDGIYFDFIERELDTLKDDSSFPDSLVSFNKDLELLAAECCGFKNGSFSFSTSYHKVMHNVFPMITHTFE